MQKRVTYSIISTRTAKIMMGKALKIILKTTVLAISNERMKQMIVTKKVITTKPNRLHAICLPMKKKAG